MARMVNRGWSAWEVRRGSLRSPKKEEREGTRKRERKREKKARERERSGLYKTAG
jgi:hypothetical protein